MAQAYVDEKYYEEEFEGTPVSDDKFSRFSKRATEIVDALTEYQILKIGLDKFSEDVQELIKKACCAQIEYYQVEGIDVDVSRVTKKCWFWAIENVGIRSSVLFVFFRFVFAIAFHSIRRPCNLNDFRVMDQAVQ